MEKRLSRWGIGPRTFLPTAAYGVVAGAATYAWPDACLLRWPPYTVFKLLIHREDEYLERRFGQAYLDYRARVNEVVPLPRFWLRK
jgi:protein-S-isoprenylcysteine O-methyltransferase Ste14